MKFSDKELVARTLSGDVRAIARFITRIESDDPGFADLAARMRRPQGRAHVIGITGAPGAGKSTLVDVIARTFRQRGEQVAVLAVDPSSPFTGGAILGDRIRMNQAAEDPSIFIRSMATRGALGGLAKATLEAIHILDCAGFDRILVETVGIGQAEVDIVRTADTCVVVLVPGMGDSVQIIKAGLMEIGDLFVINKSDREGAFLLERELLALLSLEDLGPNDWRPKIVKSVATTGQGIDDIVSAALEHRAWLETSPAGKSRRLKVISQSIITMIVDRITRSILHGDNGLISGLSQRCVSNEITPIQAVGLFFKEKGDLIKE